jgi:hypothetical protein
MEQYQPTPDLLGEVYDRDEESPGYNPESLKLAYERAMIESFPNLTISDVYAPTDLDTEPMIIAHEAMKAGYNFFVDGEDFVYHCHKPDMSDITWYEIAHWENIFGEAKEPEQE